jgi:hypothetical protein
MPNAPGERYALSDLICARTPLDPPTLAAFIARCGVRFKPCRQSLR